MATSISRSEIEQIVRKIVLARARPDAPVLRVDASARHLYLFGNGEAEPAIFLGDAEAEQAELFHLSRDVIGDAVFLGDLAFDRPQPFGVRLRGITVATPWRGAVDVEGVAPKLPLRHR